MHKMYVLVKVLVMLTEMIDVSDVFFFFYAKFSTKFLHFLQMFLQFIL